LRIEFPGALYHVTSRGNERRDIFLGDGDNDRHTFLEVLGHVCARFDWLCHAYCLMGNHYHLLVETPEPNLSQGMRQLNSVYSQHVNRRHGRVGHLFQGRFKGILIEKDSYLLEVARYVVLNPVRAHMVSSAAAWPWSSYRATADEAPAPPFLATDKLLGALAGDRELAIAEYRRFVAAGIRSPSPWVDLKNQIYLGSERFVEETQRRIDSSRSLREIPKVQRRSPPKPLELYAALYDERERAMAEAYRSGSYSMQAIAEWFGVGRSTVSRAVHRYEPLPPPSNH
jgi:REP element-mobilizing transposase RayT